MKKSENQASSDFLPVGVFIMQVNFMMISGAIHIPTKQSER